MKTPVLLSVILGWVASVVGAWWLGQQSGVKAEQQRFAQIHSELSPMPPPPLGRNGIKDKAQGETGSVAHSESVDDILRQLKVVLRAGAMNNPTAGIKAIELLGKIRDEDIPKALEAAQDVKEPQAKMMLYMILLSRWAEKDGPAALAYAEKNVESQGMLMKSAKMGVLASWAQSDPDAAWAHFKNMEEGEGGGPLGGRSMMLAGLFSSLAGKDVDQAFARLSELEEEGERTMALTGLAQAAFNEETRNKVMEKINGLEDADERKKSRAALLGQLALFEPETAQKMAAEIPVEERSEIVQQIGSMMMMNDPRQAATYMLENAEPDKRPEVYERVVNQWGNMDTNAAGEWLGRQPQGPELDRARAAFSRIAANKDPESAMEWAKTVSEETQRHQAVEHVYNSWKKKDETAANGALEQVGLPQEALQRLRDAK